MTQVNFRINENIKKNAEKVLGEMGLTISSAITIFLVKVSKEKRIPFDICIDPFYNDANIAELERRITDIKNKKCTLKEHDLIKAED